MKASRVVRLADVCEITYGTSAPTVANGTVPVIGMQHIRDGKLDLSALPGCAIDAKEVEKLRLHPGDILFNRTNSLEHVGKSALFQSQRATPTVFASYLVRLRSDLGQVEPAFLAEVLAAPSGMRQIKAMATQGVQQCNINPSRLAAHFTFRLPPLNEQRAVAAVAAKLDAAIAQTRDSAEAKRRLKRALLQQLLSGKSRTKTRVVTLGDVVRLRSGNTPSKARSDYWGGDYPWISAKDLKRARIGESIDRITELAVKESATVVPPGTVVVLVRGMTLLKDVPVALATRDLAINQDIKGLEPTDDIDPSFLLCSLAAKRAQLMGFVNRAGHGTGKLDTDRLLSLPLRLPSLSEQRRAAAAVELVDREITLLNRQFAAYRQLKRGLMQKLLTGEIALPTGPSTATQTSIGTR